MRKIGRMYVLESMPDTAIDTISLNWCSHEVLRSIFHIYLNFVVSLVKIIYVSLYVCTFLKALRKSEEHFGHCFSIELINVLVKSFTMFIRYCSKIICEEIQSGFQEVNFQ